MADEIPKAVRAWFKQNGRKGGRIGGKVRAGKLSQAERSAIARQGGLARQAKARHARTETT